MSPQAAGREGSVAVLVKAAAVLDFLAAEGEAPVKDIAERLNEPRSTVYRLLATLMDVELIEPGTRRSSYRLGIKLVRLGNAVLSSFDVRAAARPVMEDLHRRTGETIFLSVLRDDSAVCVERLDGRRVQVLALAVGTTLPLHAGAAPRVLLAWQPESRWEEYASKPMSAFTAATPVTPKELFRLLREIRSTGVALSDEDVTEGIAAVGAPVFDHTGGVCAALSIAGVRPAILGDNEADMIANVAAGAREISVVLGNQGEGPSRI